MTRALLLAALIGLSLLWLRLDGGRSFAALKNPQAVPASGEGAAGDAPMRLRPLVRDLRLPVAAVGVPGEDRILIVEQGGLVRVLRGDRLLPEPLLDLRRAVRTRGSEQGLLGLALHPRFAGNGRFFVHYSAAADGAGIVAERRLDPPSSDLAAPGERVLLRVEQPFSNHNGGHLAFSPKDGYLYVGFGDGGSGGDPRGNGQDPASLLGKMLRLDVDGPEPYGLPDDNLGVRTEGMRPEIQHLGLRNPWRYDFDPETGDLFVADVGQNRWEEIDVAPAGSALNFGWNRREGRHCTGDPPCEAPELVDPVWEERHGPGCSVTGGVVYRGAALPALRGAFLFSDYCANGVRGLVREGEGWKAVDWTPVLDPGGILQGVSSFGRDGAGEPLVLSHRDGVLYRIEPP